MSERFKSLPGVILNQERTTLRRAEELALVMGLAASRLRGSLDEQDEQLFNNRRRLALGAVILILVLAIGGAWYLSYSGNQAALTPLIIATLIALAVVAILFLIAPYTDRFRLEADKAAVTRVAQFFWPIGILPLTEGHAVLFDPLTANGEAEPLGVVQLPPALGLAEEQVVAAGADPTPVLGALNAYEEQLSALVAEPVAWPANAADESARQLGPEVNDLWQRMVAAPEIATKAIVGTAQNWPALVAEGERLHNFYQEREGLDLLVQRYGQRAQSMVDGARATVVQYDLAHQQTVENDHTTHFPGAAQATTPLLPGQPLTLTVANQAAQIRASADKVVAALQPLDADIARVMAEYDAQEQAALAALPAAHRAAQDDIELIERKIAMLDSDILNLGATLDNHHQRIVEGSERVSKGFATIAATPVDALRGEIVSLDKAVQQANSVIESVTPRLDLPALDVTARELIVATERAHVAWVKLSLEMPGRSDEVRWQIESVQDKLKALTENTVTEQGQNATVQEAVRSVERIVRGVVGWTNAQQDPISPLEDADKELANHLVVLRELRAQLEQASSTYAATTGHGVNGHLPALPTAIERVDSSLSRFNKVTDENREALAALTNAAETVRKQADLIADHIRERDALRREQHSQQEQLQRALREGEASIKAHWQAQREALRQKRAAITPHTATLNERIERTLHDPFFQAGVINDPATPPWAAKITQQMGRAIDSWGQRVADVDSPAPDGSVVARLGALLAEHVAAVEQRAVAVNLDGTIHTLRAQICFVPFWYVETSDQPDQAEGRRQVHLFPPLQLNQPVPTEIPTIASLRYNEISRRLLAHLRRDFRNGGDPLNALTFDPAVLSDAGKAIAADAGTPPWQEMATALAQQWVFFRVDDPILNRIIENSRNRLLPAEQMGQVWLANAQQALSKEADKDGV